MSAVESVDEQLQASNGSFTEVFALALRGDPTTVRGVYPEERALPVHDWLRPASHSDRVLLGHCRGTTVDVGCGCRRVMATTLLAHTGLTYASSRSSLGKGEAGFDGVRAL